MPNRSSQIAHRPAAGRLCLAGAVAMLLATSPWPRVLGLHTAASAEDSQVVIAHEPLGQTFVGVDVELRIAVPEPVDRAVVYYRPVTYSSYTTRDMQPDNGGFVRNLPFSQSDTANTETLEYYFQVWRGGSVAGTSPVYTLQFTALPAFGPPAVENVESLSQSQFRRLLTAGKPNPLWTRWWVWAIAGAVVAGGAYAAASGGGDSTSTATLTAELTFLNCEGCPVTVISGGNQEQIVYGNRVPIAFDYRVSALRGTEPYSASITCHPPSGEGWQCASNTTFSSTSPWTGTYYESEARSTSGAWQYEIALTGKNQSSPHVFILVRIRVPQ
ncbi:MAG: hypothetical protein HYV63_14530 [Candidatus Schekmanbacteria bacterium]|nr:hypothetical protein [Candidatus Schekmanbacteria bacterium]